jgi:MFS family permease
MELKNRQRVFLSLFFFLSGFGFASWASRIPTIKAAFDLNDAELGTILLTMPVMSFIGVPISGWMVSRYDSRIPLAIAFTLLAISIICIGFAPTILTLICSIGLFAFALRLLNISMNTQAITLQKKFERRINGSFHGLWSTGGILGVGFSTLLVALKIPMNIHLSIVSVITLLTTMIAVRHLLTGDRVPPKNKFKLSKPDPYIIYLGLMMFLACVCEGGMFDWSGIYFKEVVQVEVFTWGYLTFMICMALSRFASDRIIEKIGVANTYMLSSVLIICGIILSTILPFFWTAIVGFCLVGLGTASVIPMTYLLAGSSTKYSPGIVISIIATYGIIGMLIGPPLIGYLAHAFNLRIAFIAFGISGLMLIPVSQLFFKRMKASS